MSLHQAITVVLVLSLSFTGLAFADPGSFRGGSDWCGNPDAIQSVDNPYVKLAHANVQRARSQRPSAFWLTWGATAPESKFCNDAKLHEQAIELFDKEVAKAVEKQETFWSLTGNLECLRLWERAENPPAEKLAKWKADILPLAEKNYQLNVAKDSWTSVAPNTLHQSATILQLASLIYDQPKYAKCAKQLVDTAATLQNKDGAFNYIRQSGPSQVYYGFDATFLGRYYQLSRDEEAKERLIKLAGYSHDVLANGLMEASSAPWWKHHWGQGGPMHGVEIAAGLSRDPLTRSIARYRIEHGGQPYMFGYYAMYFWDPTIRSDVPLGSDILRYNTNIGGPQLRKDAWQVVMPGKAYADTNIGVTVVTGEERFGYQGYLSVAALPVLRHGATSPHDRPKSLITASTDAIANRRCVVGENWIASAWTFKPRQPFFANFPEPQPGDWQLAQLWFADEQGAAGWISVMADKDTDKALPRGYVAMGHDVVLDSANGRMVQSGALQVQVWGQQVTKIEPYTVKEKTRSFWIDVTDKQTHQAGDSYGYGLSVSQIGQAGHQASLETLAEGILAIKVQRAGQSDVTLAFNPTDSSLEISRVSKVVWQSNAPEGGKALPVDQVSQVIQLAPGALIVMP
ncbi:MAG: hypothetical protein CMJ19_04510 [Phycisphaeraceae bacterium]|nr:hypothetical protein [Phycisphaeraceae bacterium]